MVVTVVILVKFHHVFGSADTDIPHSHAYLLLQIPIIALSQVTLR